jgi:hypothetical protein
MEKQLYGFKISDIDGNETMRYKVCESYDKARDFSTLIIGCYHFYPIDNILGLPILNLQ